MLPCADLLIARHTRIPQLERYSAVRIKSSFPLSMNPLLQIIIVFTQGQRFALPLVSFPYMKEFDGCGHYIRLPCSK
jgi:hypothetical protein